MRRTFCLLCAGIAGLLITPSLSFAMKIDKEAPTVKGSNALRAGISKRSVPILGTGNSPLVAMGTLVNDRWVLSLASAIQNQNVDGVELGNGPMPIQTIIIHPEFQDYQNNLFNFALIKLAGSASRGLSVLKFAPIADPISHENYYAVALTPAKNRYEQPITKLIFGFASPIGTQTGLNSLDTMLETFGIKGSLVAIHSKEDALDEYHMPRTNFYFSKQDYPAGLFTETGALVGVGVSSASIRTTSPEHPRLGTKPLPQTFNLSFFIAISDEVSQWIEKTLKLNP